VRLRGIPPLRFTTVGMTKYIYHWKFSHCKLIASPRLVSSQGGHGAEGGKIVNWKLEIIFVRFAFWDPQP